MKSLRAKDGITACAFGAGNAASLISSNYRSNDQKIPVPVTGIFLFGAGFAVQVIDFLRELKPMEKPEWH
jgi:hypothetical protein